MKNQQPPKELKKFEIYYTIQGVDFIFNDSQKVTSDYADENKLSEVFRQHLSKRFPVESIQIKSIRPLPMYPQAAESATHPKENK